MVNEKSMDDLFLVKCNFNWADEFDLVGFEILSCGDLLNMREDMQKLVRSSDYNEEYEICFGINECLDFSPGDVIGLINNTLKHAPIASDDAKVIKRILGSCSAVCSLNEIVNSIMEQATADSYSDETEYEDE